MPPHALSAVSKPPLPAVLECPGAHNGCQCLPLREPTQVALPKAFAVLTPSLAAFLPPPAGGLVYVSDRVGEHDFSLLRRLVLPDGSVLRCLLPGRPTADCLFRDVSRDHQTVLKVRCGVHTKVRSGEVWCRGGASLLLPRARLSGPGGAIMVSRSICPALWPPQPNRPPLSLLPQIWNLNSVTGVVGLFNMQASWEERWWCCRGGVGVSNLQGHAPVWLGVCVPTPAHCIIHTGGLPHG
jgi:hypothetical protein